MLVKSGVKLLDFGLARLTEEARGEEESTAAQLSGAGRLAGTVPYMSPEQLSWAKADARSASGPLGWCSTRCWPGAARSREGTATPWPRSAGDPRRRLWSCWHPLSARGGRRWPGPRHAGRRPATCE
jgi:serine/threonine protein kinase